MNDSSTEVIKSKKPSFAKKPHASVEPSTVKRTNGVELDHVNVAFEDVVYANGK